MSKLADLQRRRRQLVERSAQTAREIEAVDSQILSLIERARSVLVGDEQETPVVRASAHALKQMEKSKVKWTFVRDLVTGRIHGKKVREPSLQRPIMEVLGLAGSPLMQQDLLKMLLARGVNVKGKKPRNTLSAHVSYLVKKGVLVRHGDAVTIKQASLPGTNEDAVKAH
jgi:hypothetical protein